MSGAKVKLGKSDIVIRGAGYILITIYALACIIPFLLIIGTSFTNEAIIHAEGVQLIPKDFLWKLIRWLQKRKHRKSYILTIVMTGVGTFLGLSIISMTGYALQRKDFLSVMRFPSISILQAFLSRSGSLLSADDTDISF